MAFYSTSPQKLEAVGNGSYLYRWNIREVESVSHMDNEEQSTEPATQFECEEVTVWAPLSPNKITEAVITSKWDNNFEQKLINEYNSAQLGLYGAKTSEDAKAHIKKYADYLTERASLKAQVDSDCAELGIK